MLVNSSIVAALGLAMDQFITDNALYWIVQKRILSQNSKTGTRFNRTWIIGC